MHALGLLIGAFGLGAALGILPGPVQFVLLTESARGGVRRGFTAMAGANGTFGALLVALAAGIAVLAPAGWALRTLRIAGGAFLLWLAWDGLRAQAKASRGRSGEPVAAANGARGLPPAVRGIVAVLLNPGAWVFLATTASALFATAGTRGGRGLALTAAAAMLGGVVVVDGSMVLIGGASRTSARIERVAVPVFAAGVGLFGAVLVAQGLGL